MLFLWHIYIFTIVGFLWLRNRFLYAAQNRCGSVLQCFAYSLDFGVRSPGGIADVLADAPRATGRFYAYLTYDLIFYFIVVLLIINCILAIVIDTFSELRQRHLKIQEERLTFCLICGIPRTTFDEISPLAFHDHVKQDHNIWNYVFFMFHVRCKAHREKDELTGPESYVKSLLEKQDISFFPAMQSTMLQSAAATATKATLEHAERLKQQITMVATVAEEMAQLDKKICEQMGDLFKVKTAPDNDFSGNDRIDPSSFQEDFSQSSQL